MARKIAQIVYMEAEQADWLKRESERSGAPITEIVRRAVNEYRRSREEAPRETQPTT